MQDKLELYDVLGVLVPGVIVVCAIALACPDVAAFVAQPKFPESFAVIGLTAAAIFAGYLVQALASILEPVLDWSWGGRISEAALNRGLGERYLPLDSAMRIRAKLCSVAPEASTRSLFLRAMRLAEDAPGSKVARFNALYAYHRALTTLTLVTLAFYAIALRSGVASALSRSQRMLVLGAIFALLYICWYRTKQRGMYYVREVLLCAEQQLAK